MVIDCHTHLLPQIDDGAKSVEQSIEMLRAEAMQGVDVVIATPHFYGDKDKMNNFIERRDAAKKILAKALENLGDGNIPQIKLGAEVAYFAGISRADDIEKLCVEGTNTILVEMPFAVWSDRVLSEIVSLVHDRELDVVLVHVERYLGYKGQEEKLKQLRKIPVMFQANAESLLNEGFLAKRKNKKIIDWFDNGMLSLLGSDCHNMGGRKPNLSLGREKLSKEVLNSIDKLAENLLLK